VISHRNESVLRQGTELALVPFFKDIAHFIVAEVKHVLHETVCFCENLHVTVLDSVMDHLDVMPGSTFTYLE
jgi:hypothetical protein